jgi:hypothetical protein
MKSMRRISIWRLGFMSWLGLLVMFSVRPLLGAVRNEQQGWTTPIDFSKDPETYSVAPLLLCDPYQNVRVFWVEKVNSQATAAVFYYRDDTAGEWSEPVELLNVPNLFYLSGAITTHDILHLMWITRDGLGDLVYSHAPLSEAGYLRGWTSPQKLVSNASFVDVVTDQTGTLYAFYNTSDSKALEHTLTLIQSVDDGQSWSPPKVIQSFATPLPSKVEVQGAVDGAGRLHVGYTVRSYEYAAYSRVAYLRSNDKGQTWTEPLILNTGDQRPGTARLGVYTFGDSEVHLTWDAPARLHQWSKDGGVTWSPAVRIANPEPGAAFGGYNELAKDAAGTLHVVYAVRGGVYVADWDGVAWQPAERLLRDPQNDPHRQQLVVCQGNQLHTVYQDNDVEHSEIWYSTEQVKAPHIDRAPVPSAALGPIAIITPAVTAIPSPTLEPGRSAPSPTSDRATSTPPSIANPINRTPPPSSDNSFSPILLAVGAALLCFVVLAVIRLKRK